MAIDLIETEDGLSLAFRDSKRGKPYIVDFTSGAWRLRFERGVPRDHILRRAVGLKKEKLHVMDATAGFGQDSMLLLTMGCSVTAIERSPIVARVLSDGLNRARARGSVWQERLRNIKLVEADAAGYLTSLLTDQFPDVVYLDPMFDKPKKSAKSPKEMQILQEILGSPPSKDEELALLNAALRVAKNRVVLKRALKAPVLSIFGGPQHSYKGQSIRYDVYLVSRSS